MAAVQSRHDNVGQEEVHVKILLGGGQAGFDPVSRFKDQVSDFCQLIADKVADTRIVFDEEDGL